MDKRNIDYRIIVSLGCKYIAQRMMALKKMPSDLYEDFSVP